MLLSGKRQADCSVRHRELIISWPLQVELQMTTKLNYWRFLPPQAHGDTLVFLLITPVGGFHWVPLEDSPRPKQIWRRGRDLQGKKILSYEEGGSNGLLGSESRSTMALVLASAKGSHDPVEAWCLSVEGGLKPLCISTNVLGAALFNPRTSSTGNFIPWVVTLSASEGKSNSATLRLTSIFLDRESETMSAQGTTIEEAILCDYGDQRSTPAMAMGDVPIALCLTCKDIIVVIFRSTGYIMIYIFRDEGLTLQRDIHLERYVVDAAVRENPTTGGMEVVALVCDGENLQDGRIVTIGTN